MPFSELNIVPSVNIVSTDADNPSGVSFSNFIRWKGALPEKRGGCTLLIKQKLDGIPVDLQPWGDIDGQPYVGVATTSQIYAAVKGANSFTLNPITPKYLDSLSSPPNLTTVAGSSMVTVVDPAATSLTEFDSVTFYTPVSLGGLVLLGTYKIDSLVTSTSYVIDAHYLATSSATGGIVPSFTTTYGSSLIQLDFPISFQFGNLREGDRIGLAIPTAVGGLVVEGQYIIDQIVSPTQIIIADDTTASSAATALMNNGNMGLRYWVTQGPIPIGAGWGQNQYGQGPYGQGVPSTNPVVGQNYTAQNWYLDNRGAALIASAVGGPIFYWVRSSAQRTMAILDNAPVKSNGAFVSMPYGHIMAWGASDAINVLSDPLYIRWSDAKDINNWSLAGDSDAGFYTIPTGSKIVRGIQGQTQQYWFTDVDLYAAQYVGYPTTYGFNKIGNGCGLVAPKGVGLLNSSLYWMSNRQFFVCPAGGAPQPIPCSVWDFIFQNMDFKFQDRVVCGTNSLFNEVMWFFPTKEQDDPNNPTLNAYVCLNAQYNEWDVGYLNRTAWYDQSIVGEPIASDANGYVYQHETSNNLAIGSATVPINSWFKTGYFSLTDGQDLSFVDWLLPDFKWGQYDQLEDADIQFTFYVTDYTGQTPREYGPYTVTKQTPYITPRFRGRFMAIKVESNDLNSFWRLGSVRFRFAPSGRR